MSGGAVGDAFAITVVGDVFSRIVVATALEEDVAVATGAGLIPIDGRHEAGTL